MLEHDVEEARLGEILVTDIKANVLRKMFHYIYTGELEMEDMADLQPMIYAADKYDLPGLKALVYVKVASGNVQIKEELIADMLITADLHQSKELEEVALQRLRNKRKILQDPGFRKKFKSSQNVDLLFDLMEKI